MFYDSLMVAYYVASSPVYIIYYILIHGYSDVHAILE